PQVFTQPLLDRLPQLSLGDACAYPGASYFVEPEEGNLFFSDPAWARDLLFRAPIGQVALPQCATYRETILASTPLAYWRLGESSGLQAADEMGVFPGTFAGAPNLGAPAAISTAGNGGNTATNFAQSNDYVSIPDAALLRLTGSFSLELWVKSNDTNQSPARILNHGNSYSVRYQQTNGTVQFSSSTASTCNPGYPGTISDITLDDTSWHHIVYAFDDPTNTWAGYRDGRQVFATSCDFHLPNTAASLLLAAAADQSENGNLQLDEVAIYTKGLSPWDVRSHFEAGVCDASATRTPTPTALYTLTATPGPLFTSTPTKTPTKTNTSTRTATPTPSVTPTRTASPSPSPTSATPPPCSQYRDAVLGSTPVAYWRFNEQSGSQAFDELGTHPGTYFNAPTLGAPGPLADPNDHAVNFNQANDYVLVPDAVDLRLSGHFAIEMWVKINSTTQIQKYFLNRGNRYTVLYEYYPDTIQFFHGWYPGQPCNPGQPTLTSNLSLADTNWHHVVYSYDTDTDSWTGFRDGQQVFAATCDFTLNTDSYPLVIGAAGDQTNNVDAQIDELALYAHPLSAADVQMHYQAASCGFPTSTATPTITETPTRTLSSTPTQTSTRTPTDTPIPTPTLTASPSMTSTSTYTPTLSPTVTNSPSLTPTLSPSLTPTTTPTETHTATNTATSTASVTPSETPTVTETPSQTATPTLTDTPTETYTGTLPPTFTPTQTLSPSDPPTVTHAPSSTATLSPTVSPTASSTQTATWTATATEQPTATPTESASSTQSPTTTATATHTSSVTATRSPTPTSSPTPSPSTTPTKTNTASATMTITRTETPTNTPTFTQTTTLTPNPTSTQSATPTSTTLPTISATPTATFNACGAPASALVQYSLVTGAAGSIKLGISAQASGDVCGQSVALSSKAVLQSSNTVATKTSGTGVSLRSSTSVAGNVLTAGSKVTRSLSAVVGGLVDTSGGQTEVGKCKAAQCLLSANFTQLWILPSSATIGPIKVPSSSTGAIPETGALGSGSVVVDVSSLLLGANSTLNIVGGPDTQRVLIRVATQMRLSYGARITLQGGLTPDRVAFLVNRTARAGAGSTVAGTVIGNRVRIGSSANLAGALFGIHSSTVGRETVLNYQPYTGW
ncbi:MAG: hypothetical protein HY270_15760, partial [Deltaproteobacteria bacterium]|nr:hypothetical protein [Deltaproteobacteria bacterium]